MKQFLKKYRSFSIRIGIIVFLLFFLIVLLVLQNNSMFCEWWTRTISRFYQTCIGYLFKYLPFSMTEIFFASIILGTLILLVSLVIDFIKKRKLLGLSKIVTISLVYIGFLFSYVVTTSLAYYRMDLPIELYNEKVDKTMFRPIIEYYLNDFNYCASLLEFNDDGSPKMPYNHNELNKVIEKEYAKIDDNYFSSFTTYLKPMLSSFIYREFQITGAYFGVLGEGNYNTLGTSAEYPFTFAHEIAHSKGVMRENDAQIMGAYICLNSDDTYLRYSGYIYTFSSLLSLARYTGNSNDYKELYSMMDIKILKNYNQISKYWKEHDILSDFAQFWNNLYLKLFGSESTDEYEDTPPVVDPDTLEISSFSRYQKLYFGAYFHNNP